MRVGGGTALAENVTRKLVPADPSFSLAYQPEPQPRCHAVLVWSIGIPIEVLYYISNCSNRTGRLRRRWPVALKMALQTAALVPTLPSSPRPLTPAGLM